MLPGIVSLLVGRIAQWWAMSINAKRLVQVIRILELTALPRLHVMRVALSGVDIIEGGIIVGLLMIKEDAPRLSYLCLSWDMLPARWLPT